MQGTQPNDLDTEKAPLCQTRGEMLMCTSAPRHRVYVKGKRWGGGLIRGGSVTPYCTGCWRRGVWSRVLTHAGNGVRSAASMRATTVSQDERSPGER